MNKCYEVIFNDPARAPETYSKAEMRISGGFLHFIWVSELGRKWEEAWINASLVERVRLRQTVPLE